MRAAGGVRGVQMVEVVERLRAPVESLWPRVCDVEAYPSFMPSVRATTVLERGPAWTLTRWEVELRGSVLRWTEREELDAARHRMTYRQLEGDMKRFEGFWQLTAASPTHTDAVLVVHFEIGIPMLAEILDPVAARAIDDNSRRMLRAFAPAEATA